MSAPIIGTDVPVLGLVVAASGKEETCPSAWVKKMPIVPARYQPGAIKA